MKQCPLLFWTTMIVFVSLLATPLLQAASIGIVTDDQLGTNFRFGEDIALVAKTVGLDFIVKESEGSIANILRLVSKENAALGLVQADVLGFLSWSPDPRMHRIAKQLRLVFPLHDEEVHLFARKTIQRFDDLNGKRVVVGTPGSGQWLTSQNLLQILGIAPGELIDNLPPAEAVRAVLLGEADAMFYVSGKPVSLFMNLTELQKDPRFTNLVPETHFVPLNHKKILRQYDVAAIGPEDYAWMTKTVPTISVKTMLITFDFSSKNTLYYRKRCQQMEKVGEAIQNNLPTLLRVGHKKWRDIDLKYRVSLWQRDVCTQPIRRAITQDDQLQKGLFNTAMTN